MCGTSEEQHAGTVDLVPLTCNMGRLPGSLAMKYARDAKYPAAGHQVDGWIRKKTSVQPSAEFSFFLHVTQLWNDAYMTYERNIKKKTPLIVAFALHR